MAYGKAAAVRFLRQFAAAMVARCQAAARRHARDYAAVAIADAGYRRLRRARRARTDLPRPATRA